jgi:hypothetical protein
MTKARVLPLILLICNAGLAEDIGMGELVLRVVTSFGPLTEKATIVLTGTDSRRMIRQELSPQPGQGTVRIQSIPAGRYRLDVSVPGFSAERGVTVAVTKEPVYRTVCLSLLVPIDVLRGTSVSARVRGRVPLVAGEERRAWVTFIGVYSGLHHEIETDSDGQFSIDGIADGVYVVLISRSGSQPKSQIVTLRLGYNQIEFP